MPPGWQPSMPSCLLGLISSEMAYWRGCKLQLVQHTQAAAGMRCSVAAADSLCADECSNTWCATRVPEQQPAEACCCVGLQQVSWPAPCIGASGCCMKHKHSCVYGAGVWGFPSSLSLVCTSPRTCSPQGGPGFQWCWHPGVLQGPRRHECQERLRLQQRPPVHPAGLHRVHQQLCHLPEHHPLLQELHQGLVRGPLAAATCPSPPS
jgi:hypothetical protein